MLHESIQLRCPVMVMEMMLLVYHCWAHNMYAAKYVHKVFPKGARNTRHLQQQDVYHMEAALTKTHGWSQISYHEYVHNTLWGLNLWFGQKHIAKAELGI